MHVAGTKWVENLNWDLRVKRFNPLPFASVIKISLYKKQSQTTTGNKSYFKTRGLLFHKQFFVYLFVLFVCFVYFVCLFFCLFCLFIVSQTIFEHE